MDNLERRVEEAWARDYAGSLHRSRGMFENIYALPILAGAATFFIGELAQKTGAPVWGDSHLVLRNLNVLGAGFAVGGGIHFLGSFGKEIERPHMHGEGIRPAVLLYPPAAAAATLGTTYEALLQRYGGGRLDFAGAAVIAAASAHMLTRAAREIYSIEQENAPGKDEPLARRALHNLRFAYPEAIAVAGGIAGAHALPLDRMLQVFEASGVQAAGDGLALHLAAGVLSGIAVYAGRAFIGRMFTSAGKIGYTLARIASERLGRPGAALAFNGKRLARADSIEEIVSALDVSGRLFAVQGDAESALKSYETATRLSARPYARAARTAARGYFEGDTDIRISPKTHLQELGGTSTHVLYGALSRELAHKNLHAATLFTERLCEIIPDDYHARGMHAVALAASREFERVPQATADYVEALVRAGAPLADAEPLGESRNKVWRIDEGVVPGYLRLAPSAAHARQEYENALFFYRHLHERMSLPVPPVRIGGKYYLFSPAAGDANLLDMVREGKARPHDFLQAAEFFVDVQRIGAQKMGELPDPLHDDDGYVERRYKETFLHQMREAGMRVTPEQEGVLYELVMMLAPHLKVLPRGIYKDLHPGNLVRGPAGSIVPIDWEALMVMPMQKDWMKLSQFGEYAISPRLYREMYLTALKETHEALGCAMPEGEYFHLQNWGMLAAMPFFHLEMAGYAAKDRAHPVRESTGEWRTNALKRHLMNVATSMHAMNAMSAGADMMLGLPLDRALLEKGLEAMAGLYAENFGDEECVVARIPDHRRGISDVPPFSWIRDGYQARQIPARGK